MATGFSTAVRTLTILPLRGGGEEEYGRSLYWYPAAGLVIACIVAPVVMGLHAAGAAAPEWGAFLALLFGTVLTGGLHADGLADWGDSLGRLHDREKMLEVMRDPRIGAFGVLALLAVFLGKWIVLARLLEDDAFLWLAAACMTSRFVIVDLAASMPYARNTEGVGRRIAEECRPKHVIVAALYSGAILAAVFGSAGPAALVLGWLAGRAFGFWCRKYAGGVTGDLFGAGSELTELTVLAAGLSLAPGGKWWL